jgi:hypothetical protein
LRRIEFGIHPAAALAKRIDDAVKRLGDKLFQEREKALDELVAVGAPAYLALHKAAASTDPEVSQRAKQALAQLRRRVPESRLRVREDDLIQTAKFTIVGRVLNPSLKARSPVFGDAELHITDLRGIHWVGQLAQVELEVEAAKYAVNPTQWLDTGIELILDDELSITAAGQVDLMAMNPGQFLSGPDGNVQGQGVGGHPPGALLGRIGENGPVFLIGQNFNAAVQNEGKLYLQISTSPWAQRGGNAASGSYKIKIQGGRDTQRR